MRKFIVSTIVFAFALTACGPGKLDHDPPPDDGNNRGGGTEGYDPTYSFQDPQVLMSTLTDLLEVADQDYSTSEDPLGIFNPQVDPVGFLAARMHTLGDADYDPDPFYTDMGGFNGLGMKNWVLASNGACAIAMTQNPTKFFPTSDEKTRHDYIVELLLGRLPTVDEVNTLNALWDEFSPNMHKQRTAVCTALLGSLEFLSAN